MKSYWATYFHMLKDFLKRAKFPHLISIYISKLTKMGVEFMDVIKLSRLENIKMSEQLKKIVEV